MFDILMNFSQQFNDKMKKHEFTKPASLSESVGGWLASVRGNSIEYPSKNYVIYSLEYSWISEDTLLDTGSKGMWIMK